MAAMRRRSNDTQPGRVALFLFCSALAVLPAASLQIDPLRYGRIVIEDWWGESATFVAAAIAAATFVVLARGATARRTTVWFIVLAVACAMFALEEISWGQRFIGFRSPDLFSSYNVQGEINLHNLHPGAIQDLYGVITFGMLVWGGVLPALVRVALPVRRMITSAGLPTPPPAISPLFVAPAVYSTFSGFPRADEIVEMLVAFAVLALAVDTALSPGATREDRAAGTGTRARGTAVMLAVSGCFAAGIVLSRLSDPPVDYDQALLFHARHYLPESGFPARAEALFQRLEDEAGPADLPRIRLEYGRFLRTRGRDVEAARLIELGRDGAAAAAAEHPERFAALMLLAEAHDALGDDAARDAVGRRAIGILDRALANLPPPQTETPEDAALWSDAEAQADRRARTLLRRARVRLLLEDCPAARADLAEARRSTRWARTQVALDKFENELTARCF